MGHKYFLLQYLIEIKNSTNGKGKRKIEAASRWGMGQLHSMTFQRQPEESKGSGGEGGGRGDRDGEYM